jgi:LmbE family N-acetylglucosaminyl deacetylase
MSADPLPTRKDFLIALAGGALLQHLAHAQNRSGKLLMVAAHPDDEYAFAAATYRLVRECGWTVDQAIVTNGESGYRYAALAEDFYGVSLAPTAEGRANLAEIRKKEAINAGKILGIRRHYFLDQKDLGFETDPSAATTGNWDYAYLRSFLSDLLNRERYDAVFTLLPTAETHGHHRAATMLALEAVAHLSGDRPLIFGAEPRGNDEAVREFSNLPGEGLTRTVAATPILVLDRNASFGYRDSLNYQMVANWLIAEHKTQGLFQTDYNQHRFEQFWLFAVSGEETAHTLSDLEASFQVTRPQTVAQKGAGK